MTCLAALILVSVKAASWLGDWTSTATTGQLYSALHTSLALVVIGVVIEEWSLFLLGVKGIRRLWSGKFMYVWRKTVEHKRELVEGAGFLILVIGLGSELSLDPAIEAKAEIELQAQRRITANIQRDTAPRDAYPPTDAALARLQASGLGSTIDVRSYAFDAEGSRLGSSIASQLFHAGLQNAVNHSGRTGFYGAPEFGIFVSGDKKDLVAALVSWLNEAGLSAIPKEPPLAFFGDADPIGPATIFVAAKPLPSVTP